VDDPEGFHTKLLSDVREVEERVDLWLIDGAETFRNDAELCDAMLKVARHEDSRQCFIVLAAILETPGLSERLLHVLRRQAV
jgi:alkylation response protein AidB-like acyl-CoA dehydrogenase